MAEHKLKPGIDIINKLVKLGELLNYYCEEEYIVGHKNESAVDVGIL